MGKLVKCIDACSPLENGKIYEVIGENYDQKNPTYILKDDKDREWFRQRFEDVIEPTKSLENAYDKEFSGERSNIKVIKSLSSGTDLKNPKEAFGKAKIPLELWSPLASAYGSIGLYNGAKKYGRGNYKATPIYMSIYLAAIKRHISELEDGVEFDEDGVPQLGAVLADCAIILDARAVGTLIDDRNISGGYNREKETLAKIIKALDEKHKDKNPRHFTIADNKEPL